jgi:tRNA threonylcarbamoyladenosine biosynthesis protein TsaB
MSSLILDTSTERGYIALFDGDDLLYSKEFPFGLQHTLQLMPEMEIAFQETGVRPQQLSYIAVGVGPGSYTGIRAAVAAAKSMAYACQVPLVSFCSLMAFIPTEEGPFAAMIDARTGGAYLISGIRQGDHIEYTSEPSLKAIKEIESEFSGIITIVTPNKKLLETRFSVPHVQWEESSPAIFHIHTITKTRYEQGNYAPNGEVEILYLKEVWIHKEGSQGVPS